MYITLILLLDIGGSKVLKDFGNFRKNSTAPNASVKVVKVTNHPVRWDAELAKYSLSTTHRICQGREGDEPLCMGRSRARLILSEYNSPDLPRSWRWRTTLYGEKPSSPDTLRVLLTRFAEVVKVTNQTVRWDTELAWYSPSTTHLDRRCWGARFEILQGYNRVTASLKEDGNCYRGC